MPTGYPKSKNPEMYDEKLSQPNDRKKMKIVFLSKDLYPIDSLYADSESAGLDLRANASYVLNPGQKVIIPTGIRVAIPEGYCGLVCSRSGLVAKTDTNVENSPGVIDSSYRGEIGVIFKNRNPFNVYRISRGDRIAQLVIVPILLPELKVVTELDVTERGAGGFGHSGIR